MGSKPWHKMTALVALSFLVVGCNNTPQKSNEVATKGGPASPQTAQTGPYNNLPPFPKASTTTVSTPATPQFPLSPGPGFGSNPMAPPPNTINAGPLNNTSFPPPPTINPNNNLPLGGGLPLNPAGGLPKYEPMPNTPPSFAGDRVPGGALPPPNIQPQ